MLRYCRRALQDLFDNRFVNTVTVITIALSVLIVSAFILFFMNVGELINPWKQGVRMMAYLAEGVGQDKVAALKSRIEGMYGVQTARYVSRQEALDKLREQMRRQSSLLANLPENPLPDAFEIRMIPESQSKNAMEVLAHGLEALPEISDVEYGQQWIGRVSSIIELFRIAGYGIGLLFFMASVFIVGNTIRLVLYSRRDEVEIMRLVGATDGFIKAPFYLEGIILGAVGGALGLCALFLVYVMISGSIRQGLVGGLIQLRFLPAPVLLGILLGSSLVGLLGCFLSLRQFFSR